MPLSLSQVTSRRHAALSCARRCAVAKTRLSGCRSVSTVLNHDCLDLKTEPSRGGSDSCIQTMWLQSPSTLSPSIPPLGFWLWTSQGPRVWRAGYYNNNTLGRPGLRLRSAGVCKVQASEFNQLTGAIQVRLLHRCKKGSRKNFKNVIKRKKRGEK